MAALMTAIHAGPSTARGEVHANIVSIGYQFQQGWKYRIGSWIPIVCDLSLINQTSFDGLIRAESRDRDGDVCLDEVEVHLIQANDTPASPRRYTVYAVVPSGRGNEWPVTLQVLENDENGEPGSVVEVVTNGEVSRRLAPPAELTILDDDTISVLSVSDGTIGKVSTLGFESLAVRDLDAENPLNLAAQTKLDKLLYPVEVAHTAPKNLPDRWQALEMIDAIVWDHADPTVFTDVQTAAILEWTRRGGTLVIAAGRAAGALSDSPLWGTVLPVTVDEVSTIAGLADLPDLRRAYLGLENTKVEPGAPIAFAGSTPKPDAIVLCAKDSENGDETPVITRKRWYDGSIAFVSAPLQQLLEGNVDARRFYFGVLNLRQKLPDELFQTEPVFTHLSNRIGFTSTGGVFLFFALVFALIYIAAATAGNWFLLRNRGWERHNWSAFAAVAAVATVVSLFAVQTTRGWGSRIEKMSIIDADANERFARGACYFGMRSSTDTVLDVWLPEHIGMEEPTDTTCYLKPLPEAAELTAQESSFTDPIRYRLLPSMAVVEAVRLRATVKQFEARWSGELEGLLRADVTAVPTPKGYGQPVKDDESEADASSETTVRTLEQLRGTITNELPFALDNCYLLQADKDVYLHPSNHPLTQRNESWMYCYSLGRLDPGVTFDVSQLYKLPIEGISEASVTGTGVPTRTLKETLEQKTRNYLRMVGGGTPAIDDRAQDWHNLLFVLSTLSDGIERRASMAGFLDAKRISRARVRTLDISDRITPHTAVLIGFAEENNDNPGPIRPAARSGQGRFRPIKIDRGMTMYRFLIPVDRSAFEEIESTNDR